MREFKKILIPVEFSDLSRTAAHYAIELLEKFNPKITLLHVWEVPTYMSNEPVRSPQSNAPVPFVEYVRQQVDGAMTAFVADLQNDMDRAMRHQRFLSVSTRVECGPVVDTILSVAQEENSDLIVIGSHSRGALARALLGSVSSRVLREATCPVMTIPASFSRPTTNAA